MARTAREDAPLTNAPGPKGGRSLPLAVATGLSLLGLIFLCFWLGPTAFFVLASTVVLIALFEVYDMLTQKGHRPVTAFGLLMGLAMLLTAFLTKPAYIAGVLAVALVGSALLALRPSRGAMPASDAAWTIFGLVWVGGGGTGAVAMLGWGDEGLALLVASILIIAVDDIAAYFAGTSFGRHKMAPSISPAKSWEGVIGGTIAALLAGAGAGLLLDELSPLQGLGLGAVAAFAAPVGDLLESMVKREIGIKDSGRLLPGHGGMLDRLDAILFTAPIAYLYLRFLVH